MNATKTTPIQSTINASECVASWSNHNYEMSDLYRWRVELLRHTNGRYLLVAAGSMPYRRETKWITPEAAWRFVAVHAMHPVTGYGYTDDETRAIMSGQPGRGTREIDGGLLLPYPDLSDF